MSSLPKSSPKLEAFAKLAKKFPESPYFQSRNSPMVKGLISPITLGLPMVKGHISPMILGLPMVQYETHIAVSVAEYVLN
jgi:hypothetical protein